MDKKYQIFISSTYEDLRDERAAVRDAILSMYHFPVGMELFGATNEEQWQIISETIESSDFYVLIVAHRYGTVIELGENAGISYTEREFNYALEKGIPVLCFLKDDSALVKPEYVEKLNSEKLLVFKNRIKKGRMIEWWRNSDDLAQKVTTALYKQFERTKRPGWLRASPEYGDTNPDSLIWRRKLIDEWGLERIFKTRAEKNGESDIILEKHDIKKLDGIAFGLRSFRTKRETDLLECMKNGAMIRLLVMDPESPFLTQRAFEEKTPPERMAQSIKDLALWIKNINGKSVKGKIKLKYYNSMTIDFYWRIDDNIYIGPYWYGTESQQTITYKYRSGGRGFILYNRYFEDLWNDEQLTKQVDV